MDRDVFGETRQVCDVPKWWTRRFHSEFGAAESRFQEVQLRHMGPSLEETSVVRTQRDAHEMRRCSLPVSELGVPSWVTLI